MTRRVRLETLSVEVAAAKHRASLATRYRVVAPAPKQDVLTLLRAAPPGSEQEAQLGLRWLDENYPGVLGGRLVPLEPKLHRLVDAAAREAGFSDRPLAIIRARVVSRNEHRAVKRRSSGRVPGGTIYMGIRCARSQRPNAGDTDEKGKHHDHEPLRHEI